MRSDPGGYLFLGPSESTTREAKLFAVVDKKHRILQRRDVVARLPNVLSSDVRRPQPAGRDQAGNGGECR